MTRRTSATVAGITFLVYIAVALSSMILWSRAAGVGGSPAEKLASIAAHAPDVRLAFVLELLGCFCALVLAVTLYAITRDQDPNLAMLVLAFRVGEGVIGGVSLPLSLDRLWLATASGADAPDPATANALAALFFKLPSADMMIGGAFFAVGSTVFSYLLLRGRIVPAALAWLGVAASVLVVAGLPCRWSESCTVPSREACGFPCSPSS